MAKTRYSTNQAARRLGVSGRRVRQLAAELEVGQREGKRILLTAPEIRKMDRRKKTPGVDPGTARDSEKS